jgi:hypothetical protein
MWACGIILAEHILRIVPKGTHELEKCIKPHETQALLEKCEYIVMPRLCCGLVTYIDRSNVEDAILLYREPHFCYATIFLVFPYFQVHQQLED